ncbi:MAG: hypothetical protein AAFP85_04320 [Pseudomonadota bacterium]
MRRFAIALVSVLLAVLALGFFLLPSYPVTVTQEQINEAIADRLPFVTEQNTSQTTVSAGTVTLSAGNRVATEWALETASPMFTGNVAMTAALQPHYEDGAFFLKDLDYREIQIAFVEDGAEGEKIRRDVGDLLVQGARSVMRGLLDDATTTRTFDPELTEALKQLFGGILQAFLNAFPVYDLRSAGGNIALAALVLDEVVVDDGQITATFGVQRLISQVTFFVLVILLLLLFAGRNAPPSRST